MSAASSPVPSSATIPPPPPNPNAAGAGGPPMIVRTRLREDGIREVPKRFEQCDIVDLIQLIASMLNRLIAHNDQIPLTPTSLTRFHSRAAPGISVSEYLLRICRYTNVESCCLLLLLHYIDRICERMTNFTISSLTVHRFAIASVAVGSKALSDSFCTNARYARVGGVTLAEMNLLEREFCHAIDWRLTTTGALLDRYYTQLVASHSGYTLDPTSSAPSSKSLPPIPPPVLSDPSQSPSTTTTTTTNLHPLFPTPPCSPPSRKTDEEHRQPSSSGCGSMHASPTFTSTASSDFVTDCELADNKALVGDSVGSLGAETVMEDASEVGAQTQPELVKLPGVNGDAYDAQVHG